MCEAAGGAGAGGAAAGGAGGAGHEHQAHAGESGAAGLGAVAVLGTAIIGVAHTPWGRPLLKLPLLSALARHAGCPVGPITPVAFEQVRTPKAARRSGVLRRPVVIRRSASRSGKTRRNDIEKWSTDQHVDCKTDFVASVLECENVAALGTPLILALAPAKFDGENRLVSVDLFRTASTSERASFGRSLPSARS